MQELKQILIGKAKIIGELKYPQRNNRQAILKLLKNIKKQEKQSEKREKQVIFSLFQQKFMQKQDIEKLYFLSFVVMKGLSKKFQFIPEQRDLLTNIIEMHYNFYLKEQSHQKAQQIKQLYRKNILQKVPLNIIPYLLFQLYEWFKVKLQKFIRMNIDSIEKDMLIDGSQSPRKVKQSFQKQSPQRNLLVDGMLKKISCSQKIPNKDFKIVINGIPSVIQKGDLKHDGCFFENDEGLHFDQLMLGFPSSRIETCYQPQKSEQNEPRNTYHKSRSKSYNTNCRERTVVPINLNKEIFYGAFWKQINLLYKNASCIQDLDNGYLKTFRKQKEQIKSQVLSDRIEQLVESIIKNMPQVKKSVQNYERQYVRYRPLRIKSFYSKQIKSVQLIVPKQSKKSVFSKSKDRQKVTNQQISPTRNKSQEETGQCISKQQRINKKSVAIKILQRNRTYNDPFNKKSFQYKTQRQVKLPVVYNPEHLYTQKQSDTEKVLAIHQKFEKNVLTANKPNKGLIRYRIMNRERQRTFYQKCDLVDQKTNRVVTSQLQLGKQHEYEVANIRKILRKRERQRLFINKTPIVESQVWKVEGQEALLQIKVIENERKLKEEKVNKKSQKFQVFLRNFGDSSSPFKLGKNSKLFNVGPLRINELESSFNFKQKRQDFFGKVS